MTNFECPSYWKAGRLAPRCKEFGWQEFRRSTDPRVVGAVVLPRPSANPRREVGSSKRGEKKSAREEPRPDRGSPSVAGLRQTPVITLTCSIGIFNPASRWYLSSVHVAVR